MASSFRLHHHCPQVVCPSSPLGTMSNTTTCSPRPQATMSVNSMLNPAAHDHSPAQAQTSPQWAQARPADSMNQALSSNSPYRDYASTSSMLDYRPSTSSHYSPNAVSSQTHVYPYSDGASLYGSFHPGSPDQSHARISLTNPAPGMVPQGFAPEPGTKLRGSMQCPNLAYSTVFESTRTLTGTPEVDEYVTEAAILAMKE